MNKKKVDIFEKLNAQIMSTYDEISVLSKKNPNDAVNKFKLAFVNNLISDSNTFLTEEYMPFKDFAKFDEDDMPQNSDIVFILSQYLECFEKFRSDNIHQTLATWYWTTDDKSSIITSRPKKLKN